MGILASLEIIVIPIWIDFNLPKKPAKTELAIIFFNKLVNGYSISFAKVSRPEDSHLQPLAEPYVTLSSHTAPIIQPLA